jgi:hypothetical protein
LIAVSRFLGKTCRPDGIVCGASIGAGDGGAEANDEGRFRPDDGENRSGSDDLVGVIAMPPIVPPFSASGVQYSPVFHRDLMFGRSRGGAAGHGNFNRIPDRSRRDG